MIPCALPGGGPTRERQWDIVYKNFAGANLAYAFILGGLEDLDHDR